MKWVVWYSDGTSFTDYDGAPHEAPRWGVLCVSTRNGHNRTIWHATDYYCWADGWVSCDTTGLIDYLANRPGPEKIVLMGRHVQPEQFWRVFELAQNDHRLPLNDAPGPDRRPQL